MVPFPQVAFQVPPVKLIQFQRVSPGPEPSDSLGLRSHSRWKSLVRVGAGRVTVSAARARGAVRDAIKAENFIFGEGLWGGRGWRYGERRGGGEMTSR